MTHHLVVEAGAGLIVELLGTRPAVLSEMSSSAERGR